MSEIEKLKAEIEKLKAETKSLNDQIEEWIESSIRQDNLITELTDALEQRLKIEGNTHPDWKLIKYAREIR